MKCARCKNEDEKLMYELNGRYYCRKCIQYKRVEISPLLKKEYNLNQKIPAKYNLMFTLSKPQQEISKALVTNFNNNLNSYVYACTGSGKTEICYEVIQYALNNGFRVCFCIPRTELVKELYERISNDFSGVEIGLIYGGTAQNIDAQFVICTMHQLYRYVETGFDLIIADEVDAFPFYRDEVLNEIFNNCCNRCFIKLSATFLKEDIVNGELLVMNKRYHNHPLPLPMVVLMPNSLQKYLCLIILLLSRKNWIVYVATIQEVIELTNFLSGYLSVKSITSKTLDKDCVMNLIRSHKIKAVVSTTILERGITIDDIQVMVLNTSHRNFNSRTLIQISGRVGRKPNHPTGKVIFQTNKINDSIKTCINSINYLNTSGA